MKAQVSASSRVIDQYRALLRRRCAPRTSTGLLWSTPAKACRAAERTQASRPLYVIAALYAAVETAGVRTASM
jgi:hypothetical protein